MSMSRLYALLAMFFASEIAVTVVAIWAMDYLTGWAVLPDAIAALICMFVIHNRFSRDLLRNEEVELAMLAQAVGNPMGCSRKCSGGRCAIPPVSPHVPAKR